MTSGHPHSPLLESNQQTGRFSEHSYRQQLEAVCNNATVALLILDESQQCVYMNPAAEKLTGFSLTEVRGRPLHNVIHHTRPDGTPYPLEECPIDRALPENNQEQGEEIFVHKDGSFYSVAFTASPIREGNVPVGTIIEARDITEIKRAKDRQTFLVEATSVIASSLDYQATLSSVANMAIPQFADWCGVDLIDDDGSINRLAMAHVDPEKLKWALELQRRTPFNWDSPRGVPQVLRTGKSELYSDIPESLMRLVARDEEQLQVMRKIGYTSVMIVPLVAHGNTMGAITFVHAESGRHYDADDLVLAEELAARAALAISNARLYRDSQEASRLKDEFLATMSHELRTPLNAILGWSNLLSKGSLDEESTRQALETIERNARSQVRLIEDLMDVSRIITGKLRLEVRPIVLATVIEAAANAVRPAAEAKNIRLELLLDPQTGLVSGDPDRLQQVMWNLLSNALKFTPHGGHVLVYSARVNSHVEITVTDSGQGINSGFLPHVFDRFRQADSTNTRNVGGLGLGLAIVRQLVELHGGTVQATSPGQGQGATFVVSLPITAMNPNPAARETDKEQAGDEGQVAIKCPSAIAGLKVLVVDDEADACRLVTAVLDQCDAVAITATSAAEALDAIIREQPDVLISDIGMPGEDGFSLIRKVRALPPQNGGRLPAVALTAYARAEDRIKALASGFQMHAPKPIEPGELIAIIASLARRHESTPQAGGARFEE